MNPIIQKRFAQIFLLVILQAALLFAFAGKITWVAGWAYIAIYVAFIGMNAIVLLPRSPELVVERAQIGANTKGWDKIVSSLVGACGLAILVVAGLDERLGWTHAYTLPTQAAGALVIAIGYGFFGWAMASNKFFAVTVRIQSERGHTVQNGGPYQLVRHPAYLGMILYSLGTPALLDSVPAFLPALLLAVLMIVRTNLEDDTLKRELPGYAEFCQQTRYRLVPGIW